MQKNSKKLIVEKKSRSVVLCFNTKVYSMGYILESARSFSDSCWVYVDGDPAGALYVTLTPKSEDMNLQRLGYEFYNYTLGLIKTKE